MIADYINSRREETKLLADCAEGTFYEGYVCKLADIELEYSDLLWPDKLIYKQLSGDVICLLTRTFYRTFFDFTKQILMFSGASGEILELALRYLRIIFTGSLFVNFAQSSNMIMRGGLLKRAMLFSAGSTIMNIILDPISILLLKPYGMGFDGAAYVTVASQVAYAMASLWYFKRKSKTVRINSIRIERTLFSEIIGVGFSAMLMLVQQTALYNLAAHHGGDTWQIILGATYRVVSFAFIPLWGISQGYQPAIGTNYGAKQYDRVKHITKKVFAITATLLALIFYLPIMLVPKTILSRFITTPSVVELGVGDFRLFFLSYILLGVWIVVLTLMQTLGRATKASVLVILRQIAIYIPAAITMPYIAGFCVHGIFAAPLITDVTVFIVVVGMMINEFKRMDALKTSGSKRFGFNNVWKNGR